MKKSGHLTLLCVLFLMSWQAFAQDAKMNMFIDSLMSRMTLAEKLGQLNLSSGVGNLPVVTGESGGKEAYVRQGLIGASAGLKNEQIAVKESRLKIPLLSGRDVIHGYQTTFPIPLAMACMWDMKLVEKSARIAASEASASGINWTYSPMVDIARDPRWGRVAEGAGEDPWYGEQVAKAYVKGYQGNDLSKNNTIMACVKHFALYGAAEGGRDYNTVDMSRLRMYNVYLRPYKAAVEAGAGSAMSSFNLVDFIPSSGNNWLLTDVLRNQWGFKGFVVSDYTAINEMINHGVGADTEDVAVLALKAGLDMDMMGQAFIGTLSRALKEGKVTQDEIDQACRRVLEAKYKLGLFHKPFQYFDKQRAEKVILSKEHLWIAREIAKRSIVLLKNDNHILPLKKSGTIAVIGPLADTRTDMLGAWAATGDTSKVVSILEGIKNVAGKKAKVLYARGSGFTDDPYLLNVNRKKGEKQDIPDPEKTRKMREEAVRTAGKADVVVMVLGEPRKWSGEAASRSDIGIPECQRELLKTVLETGTKVVLVLVNGRPLTLPWEDAHVDAILEAWHGGTEAGNGLADVLFGDYNPSGKLTITFPRNVGQIPVYYNHYHTGRPMDPSNKFTSKYLDIPNEPLYPFGYGLSYTTFGYGDIKLNKTRLQGNDSLIVTIPVTNTGKVKGEEVVQLYVQDPVASISRPVKELKNFRKISLQPGETRRIRFTITPADLKFYNSQLVYDWESGDFNIYVGPNSGDVKKVTVFWEK
ncbi:MAG: beta-glucosidase BglX [Bacteroidales bacterium]|nr:beta-glucosidase BglX [Bacteroidales bacterium]